jgi:hypothetical protein
MYLADQVGWNGNWRTTVRQLHENVIPRVRGLWLAKSVKT